MKNLNKKFILSGIVIFLLSITLSYPHPGRTDKNGCHHCWTNCEEKWGIPYGFYHRHNPVRPCFEEENKSTILPKLDSIPTSKEIKKSNDKILIQELNQTNENKKIIQKKPIKTKKEKEFFINRFLNFFR